MKVILTAFAFLLSNALYSQAVTTIGGTAHTGSRGLLCVSSAFSNTSNVNTSSITDFARFNLLAGVGCSYYLHSTLNGIGAGGTRAGFHIETDNLLNLLSSITIETYLNGRLQESASGSNLLTLLNNGKGDVYFNTTMAYDAIRINFNISVSVASDFRIYWGFGDNSTVTTLPVSIYQLQIKQHQQAALLQWQLHHNGDNGAIVVEKSIDGSTYAPIASVQAQNKPEYSYQIPHSAIAWYRIKVVSSGGTTTYSKAILFQPRNQQSLTISPNPAKGNNIIVTGNWSANKKVHYVILNAMGIAVQNGTLQQETTIDISRFEKGIYFIKTDDGTTIKWSKL